MDEIKIEKLDGEQTTEKLDQKTINPEIEKVTSEEEIKKSIPKKFIIMIAVIIFIFIAILSFNLFSSPTGQVVTIDELFIKNLQGDLPKDQGYVYKGFSFVLFDNLWYTEVQHQNKIFQIPLHFGPKDLEDVNVTGQLDGRFDQVEIYITFDPLITNDYITTAIGELTQNLATGLLRQPIGACDKNETQACYDRPIINCTNTNQPVIHFLDEPGPKIELKGNCVVLKGKEYDVLKATDRLLLQWYKVMD